MSLTAQFYAGDTDKLWTAYSAGGTHTGVPTNGSTVVVWQDEATTGARNLALHTTGTGFSPPNFRTPGSMKLPSLEFNGTTQSYQLYNNVITTAVALSGILANNGKTIIMAVRFNVAGTNSASIWENAALFADDPNGYMGIHFKTVSGVHSLIAYNWDGNADTCSINVSLDTNYIIMVRHDGTTLNLSVLSGNDGGTRSNASVASGNTSAMTGSVRVARNRNTARWGGIIGEMYFDNTDLGSTNTPLSDIVSRWLPVTPSIPGLLMPPMQSPIKSRF